ncbi:hypothetical protein AB0K68_52215, partial [Streptomyces sp. NPDC050698]
MGVGSSVGGVRVVVTAVAQPDESTDDTDHDNHAERGSGDRHLLALAGTFCATFELTLELAFRRLAALLVTRHCCSPPYRGWIVVGRPSDTLG